MMMTLKAPPGAKILFIAFCMFGAAGCNVDAPNPSANSAASAAASQPTQRPAYQAASQPTYQPTSQQTSPARFANRAEQVHAQTGEIIQCPNDYRCFQAPD